MSLSLARSRSGPRLLWPGLVTALCLLLATVLSLALAEMLLSPTARDLRALALYLVVSGAVTLMIGWAGLRVADRGLRLGIQAKVIVAGAIGSGVGLLNVFVVAKLMFLSDVHDLRLLVALLVFSGVLTNFFNVWVALTTTARVVRATATLETLAEGDYMAGVPIEGRDEAAQLGTRVNQLATRLRESEEDRAALERERRELTAAASHDLRTPLSSLRAMVDALQDRIVEEPDEVRRYYATMARELDHLSRMVDGLFELTQIDARAFRLDRQHVRLQDIAAEVADAMHAEAAQREIGLSLEVSGAPPAIPLDGARIERALTNLVQNALEHTPAGGDVKLRVESVSDGVAASVTDTGEGIGPGHLPRIWERFYRADPSRARADKAGGAGLGLAIVRGVVEAHGGNVDVQSEVGSGSCFTLRLPVAYHEASRR